METKDTLKEYYVNIQSMYVEAIKMLTAINQSLSTTSSEVIVNMLDTDDTTLAVRIPSFLYLENKLEQLESNFNALFNMPETGEAWFNSSSNMHKLELVKSTLAPLVPYVSKNNIFVQSTENNFLKDLVSPKMFIRFNITNLPNNINELFVKKIIFHNEGAFSAIYKNDTGTYSYNTIKNLLANLNVGSDYTEYDQIIKTPVKRNRYSSEFKIVDLPNLDSGNPWRDYSYSEDSHSHLRYSLSLDTLIYRDSENTEFAFSLKAGDIICLRNENVLYKVISVTQNTNVNSNLLNTVVIEEKLGHIALQTTEENSAMVFEIYDNDYSDYHYVDIPLEENPYLAIFVGSVYNNVRSELSSAIIINLNDIYVRDADGNVVTKNGNPINYITYYNEYCNNIGDLIEGLSETAYPQLSNFSSRELFELTSGLDIQQAVSETVIPGTDIIVKKINSHLMDDDLTQKIKQYHEEKSNINTQLANVQNNIDQIYNQLTSTDFSTELNVTQFELKKKLSEYYQERTQLTKQKINIVDNINVYKSSVKSMKDSKFRVRGMSNPDMLIMLIKSKTVNTKVTVIGMDIEYKYRSINSDTTNVSNINSSLFTDWIKHPNIERDRHLEFVNDSFTIVYDDYDSSVNNIKWNQFDIPITRGEDVIIRFRYKLNIGQPFINIYTPWSDEIVQSFPTEFEENTDISTIMTTNDNDTMSASFNKTLITEGYTEHISDRLIDASHVYFHGAENIYSGFMTSTNTLMSVKDKFDLLDNDVNKYKETIDNLVNANISVMYTMDGVTTPLYPDIENVIESTTTVSEKFIRKDIHIIVKNDGTTPIKIYSMFPGNKTTTLLQGYDNMINTSPGNQIKYYYDTLMYKNVANGDQNKSIVHQTLGQWIYFTRYNVYSYKLLNTKRSETESQFFLDKAQTTFNYDPTVYEWQTVVDDDGTVHVDYNPNYNDAATNIQINNCILVYENLYYINGNQKEVHLSHRDNLVNIFNNNADGINRPIENGGLTGDTNNMLSQLNGATLTTCLVNNEVLCDIYDNEQYKLLKAGETLSIPIVFEYFLSDEGTGTLGTVEAKLGFSLRVNPLGKPINYILTATGSKLSS